MSGKGDTPRPLSVDQKTYDENWRRTFEQPTPKTKKPKEAK